ncbi:MAG: TIGR03960 family B12-binding radical SAM protein, partial [Desulfomonilaceae bacterium]
SIINGQPDLYAERVFAPWTDMEAVMRENHAPLTTLETGTPLSELDLLGFSLQYELCATNVLQMLYLSGIPLHSADRRPQDPFVIGGGPGAFNPVPLSPFFDAFAIGDGEEVILELAATVARWKGEGGSREDLLGEWKKIPGVFVPALYSPGDTVSRRITAELDETNFPSRLVVPFCETVHDRIGIEIARGCTRGCRFCQAGMLYRPVRERQAKTIVELARNNIAGTGWEEVSLLSLSAGDYSVIGHLIKGMSEDFGPEMVALSLPSLRTDTFDGEIAEQIRKVRKTGFTLAPEAGTDRLRRVINKGNTEEDLERAVTKAFSLGWQSVKLYFMVGLPHESDEDLDGIIGLIRKASKWARGGKITASVSTFVPKPHTPFQWAGQLSIEETIRRQQYIRRYFHKGRAQVKFHAPQGTFLEGVLARGDERLSEVIEKAFSKGARFDGWSEHLKLGLWMEAFEEGGIDPEKCLEPRAVGGPLPWDFIDTGIHPAYFEEEWNKALTEQSTADCRFGDCTGCGVCDFETIGHKIADSVCLNAPARLSSDLPATEPMIRRFRLRYAKRGRMRFIGHQDLIRLFQRAFRRGGMKLDYSHGFHPHPKLKFSPPLALGLESMAEYLDFDLIDSVMNVAGISETLKQSLPEGVDPLTLDEISLNDPPVSAKIQQVTYEITFWDAVSPEEMLTRLEEFKDAPFFEIVTEHKGKSRSGNLKEWVDDLDYTDGILKMTLRSGASGSVHPVAAVAALAGLSKDTIRNQAIIKTSVKLGASLA